ncbi:MAG: tRNA (N6-threonylcarbamoyladenosine(37)-N6)-methyltransferase TrmO [Nitrospirota bacterium]
MEVEPIGLIHSPFKSKGGTPIQSSRSRATGTVEVFKEYEEGLDDIEGFSHIILIYKFHKSRGYRLKVKPFLDGEDRGLFATSYPRRPNQIGLSVVKLLKRERNILSVRGIDVIDKTPLLDIKPYVPDFIHAGTIKIGWLKGRMK